MENLSNTLYESARTQDSLSVQNVDPDLVNWAAEKSRLLLHKADLYRKSASMWRAFVRYKHDGAIILSFKQQQQIESENERLKLDFDESNRRVRALRIVFSQKYEKDF